MSGVLNWVLEWHKRACPSPDQRALEVQFGCHVEEFLEMMQAITLPGGGILRRRLVADLEDLAKGLKDGSLQLQIKDRKDLLDSIADQMVTGVGVGYRADMHPVEALTEVDISNWSKFGEDGQPLFDDNGKVMKGPGYREPDLKGLY